jgi:mRNA-degrading endonuclease toxin of MazEF toxin-antitoxin module
VVAARGWVFLTQDRRIRTRPAERQVLIEYGLRTFSIASTANLSAVETIAVLRAAKAGMREKLGELPPPFIVAIYKDGSLSKLDLE